MEYSLVPSALCTIADIKEFDQRLGSRDDAEIALLINLFTQIAESPEYCNRFFEKKTYTETFDGERHPRLILLSAPPVIAETIVVMSDPGGEFDENSRILTRNYHYSLVDGGPTVGFTGVRARLGRRFEPFAQNIRITYDGGLVRNIEGEDPDIPPALRAAAVAQVRFWYKNKNNLGISSWSTQGSSVSFTSPRMLDHVCATLRAWRRHD